MSEPTMYDDIEAEARADRGRDAHLIHDDRPSRADVACARCGDYCECGEGAPEFWLALACFVGIIVILIMGYTR